jgi:hypothetical protein
MQAVAAESSGWPEHSAAFQKKKFERFVSFNRSRRHPSSRFLGHQKTQDDTQVRFGRKLG